MKQVRTTTAGVVLVQRAGAGERCVAAGLGLVVFAGLMGTVILLSGCADDGPKTWSAGARPTYEDREIQPAQMDEVKSGPSMRVWGSGTKTTVR